MMRMLPRGLHARLAVPVSVIIIAAFFSFGYVTAEKQADTMERIIRTESTAVTRNIAESCAHYLVVWDYAGLEEILVRFGELPDIMRLQAVEPDGTILSDVSPHGPSLRPPAVKIKTPATLDSGTELAAGRLIVWHPIFAGSHLGWVKATFSLHELAELKAAVWRNTALLAALWVAASTALLLFVMRRPVNAIQRLSRFARNLNAVKGSRMEVPGSSAEIEELGEALNSASRDLKESEQKLIAERERLAVTLQSIGDGVIATDTAGRVVLLNRTAEELTGWASSDAVNMPLSDVFHLVNEETRTPLEDPVGKVIAARRIVGLSNHAALVSRDGAERSIADSGAPIIDNEGNVIGVVLAFRDVTEKKRTEEFIKSVFESIGEGLIVIDRSYRVVTANGAFSQQARRPIEQIVGRQCYEVSHGSRVRCDLSESGCSCPAAQTFETGRTAVGVHNHGKDHAGPRSEERRVGKECR